jgi:5-formyltetrahydrofolate cyclo-ligase
MSCPALPERAQELQPRRHDIARWRKSERARLIAERVTFGASLRHRADWLIAARLDTLLGSLAKRTVGAYWPIHGEPDLRPWLERVRARGATCALPAVCEPRAPVEYRP